LHTKVKESIGLSTIATGKTTNVFHQVSVSTTEASATVTNRSRSAAADEDEEEYDDEDDQSDQDETIANLFDEVALMVSEGEVEEEVYGEEKDGYNLMDGDEIEEAKTSSAKRRRSSAKEMNEVLLGDSETVQKRMKEKEMKRQSLTSSNVYMTSDENEDGEEEDDEAYNTKLSSSRDIGSEDDDDDLALTPSERKRKAVAKKVAKATGATSSGSNSTSPTTINEAAKPSTRTKLSTSLRNTIRKSIALGRRSQTQPQTASNDGTAPEKGIEDEAKRRNSIPTSPYSAIHPPHSSSNAIISGSSSLSNLFGDAANHNNALVLSNPEYLQAISSRHALQTNANTMHWPSYPILVKRSLTMLGSPYFSSSPLSTAITNSGIAETPIFEREDIQSQLQPLSVHNLAHPEQQLIPIQNDYFQGNAFFMFNHISQANQLYFE
jgi:hypothetical protein